MFGAKQIQAAGHRRSRGAMLLNFWHILTFCASIRHAVSQTKYCCSLEFKIFDPSQNFGLATPLQRARFFWLSQVSEKHHAEKLTGADLC